MLRPRDYVGLWWGRLVTRRELVNKAAERRLTTGVQDVILPHGRELAVVAGVMFAGFFGVMNGVDMMAVRDVRVMAGFLMIAGSVMLGCRAMVLGGFFVVLCGFQMVIRSRFRHGLTSGPMIQGRCDGGITAV